MWWQKWVEARGPPTRRLLEHGGYMALLAALLPGFFYFEVFLVLPLVASPHSLPAHAACALALLTNVVGNLLLGASTDCSIRGRELRREAGSSDTGPDAGWSACAACETETPPRTRHCDVCRVCVLKRDHHCSFFATCVGYNNYRYFLMFVLHVFVSMVYAFYLNVQFVSQNIAWNGGLVVIKFALPLAHFAWDYNSRENLYIFMVVVNVIMGLFTGFLFIYHMLNVIRGRTAGENSSKHIEKNLYDFGIQRNLIEVLGRRWYLTWISPIISSPLPGNGISWNEKNR